jgi:lysozyme
MAALVSGCAGGGGRAVPRVAATAPPSPFALGGLNAVIDLSHSDRVSDLFAARYQSSILGIIHKATEGVGYVDPTYAARRRQAAEAGILWGAYHFGTCQYSGKDQAQAFLEAAQPDRDTLLALDLELNERYPDNSMDYGRAEDFVLAVERATGRLPLLYVFPAWADGQAVAGSARTLGGAIRPGSALAACDLWLADYRLIPHLPSAWAGRGWRLWQYGGVDGAGGGPYRSYAFAVAGVSQCDRNLFPQDAAALTRYWRFGDAPPLLSSAAPPSGSRSPQRS